MADNTKLAVVNLGDPIDHTLWANTSEELRHGRYNKETNTTMYAIAHESATKEDVEAFFAEYPDFEPIE